MSGEKRRLKILLCTMAMDTGGAETHVFELARELVKRGNDVTVASSGGVLAERLCEYGVKCVTVPLDTKRPTAVVGSYFALRKLLVHEGFDIVHAHARIPAFICSLLRGSAKFAFVTTAHGTFRVNGVLRMLSTWGDRTLAVSEDVRDYLTENYGISRENITLTVNGLDTERFCPADSQARVEAKRREGIDAQAPTIVHVSRLELDCSLAAELLIRSAPQIAGIIPGVRIIITGSGGYARALAGMAEAANAAAGYECVRLTGQREDVENVLACADVFVGVSRAALEAASSGIPVILAGAQGMLGEFNPDCPEKAEYTNFTCRGEIMPNADILVQEVCAVLSRSAQERELGGKKLRLFAEKEYSIRRMCDDNEKVYEEALQSAEGAGKRILLCGYYGSGNAGDEATLASICGMIRERDAGAVITAVSAEPKRTAKAMNCRAVGRYNLPGLRRCVSESAAVIFGGGSLLQDATSSRSLFYYTELMKYAGKCANGGNPKIILWGNGIGPLVSAGGRKRASEAVAYCSFATLRDQSSFEIYRELGGKNGQIGTDAAFSREYGDESVRSDDIKRACGLVPSDRYFVVSVREWGGADRKLVEKLARICKKERTERGLVPVIAALQECEDSEICRTLAKACGGVYAGALAAREFRLLSGGASYMLGMRYHSLVFAFGATGIVALSYDPKVDSLAGVLGCRCFACDALDEEGLLAYLREPDTVRLNPDEQKKTRRRLRDTAERDADMIMKFINEG